MNSFMKKKSAKEKNAIFSLSYLFIYFISLSQLSLLPIPPLQIPVPISPSPSLQRKGHFPWVPPCPGTSSRSRTRKQCYFRQLYIPRHFSHTFTLRFSRFSSFYNLGNYLAFTARIVQGHSVCFSRGTVLSMWERLGDVCDKTVLSVLSAYTFFIKHKGTISLKRSLIFLNLS